MKSNSYYFTGLLFTGIALPVFVLYGMLMTVGTFFFRKDSEIEGFIASPAFLIFACISIIVFPLILFFTYKKRQQLEKLEYLTIDVMRCIVALLMFFYGLEKITGNFFDYTYRTLDTRVADVRSFDLTWYYFGRSNIQVLFIGLLELIPALMIISRRTYFAGVILLLPVAGNVLWTNVFNHVSGLTYLVSLVIMLLCSYMVYSRKQEIIQLLKTITAVKPTLSRTEYWTDRLFKKLTLFSMISFLGISLYKKGNHDHSIAAKRTGAFELERLEINNQLIIPEAGDHYDKTIYLESQPRWNAVVDYSETYHPQWITVTRKGDGDSVITYTKQHNSVDNDEIWPDSRFEGVFIFNDSQLIVKGIRQTDTINAVYHRKQLIKQPWFW